MKRFYCFAFFLCFFLISQNESYLISSNVFLLFSCFHINVEDETFFFFFSSVFFLCLVSARFFQTILMEITSSYSQGAVGLSSLVLHYNGGILLLDLLVPFSFASGQHSFCVLETNKSG